MKAVCNVVALSALLVLGPLAGLARASEPSAPSPTSSVPTGAPPTPGDVTQVPPASAAPTPLPSAAPAPDPLLAALRRELDDLKQEVEGQKALLDAASAGQDGETKEPPLRIYGWADMGANKIWVGTHNLLSGLLPTKAATFAVGNINVYFDFQPFESWSSLIEVRFTNLPDGTVAFSPTGAPALVSTQAVDYSAPIPWTFTKLGGIILPRAYIQYRHNDLLQVRVGQFLTPFGIWNVDHGTPTLIALALPVFMVQGLFPASQIGVEVLGRTDAGDWEIGYMGSISNGRTLYPSDPTDDKMLGGRLYARRSRPWHLQVGISGLTGRLSDIQTKTTSFAPINIVDTEVTAYREVDLGADLSLDVGKLRVRSELSRGQYVYDNGKRPADIFSPPGAKFANNVMLDWYLLAAYRLPWLNLEPYLYYEYFQWRTGLGAGYMAASAGLNIYFTAAAQLRLQYVYDYFFESFSPWVRSPQQDNRLFVARIVLGF